MQNNFFIITGGPGVGKTSLLLELKKRNFICVDEVAREIIKEQMSVDGNALPWKDKELYADMMLKRSIEQYELVKSYSEETTFFDRGIPDSIAYAKLIGYNIAKNIAFSANDYRYNEKVFILPPWSEIFETDNERKQTWEEAVETYSVIARTYTQYNYEVVEVPRTAIQRRAEFIVKALNLK
jgi:predicted ATPase